MRGLEAFDLDIFIEIIGTAQLPLVLEGANASMGCILMTRVTQI